ncbi:MAG: T9SS type A sorting domain-containing protein [Chitinophagaceae bacterium]|nr:T9SS type A sorting domain-containing protein [Chitinophagaceae bacterium]
MSTKNKLYTLLFCLLMAGGASAQTTLEMTTRNFFVPFLGPSTAAVGPISFERDQNNNNQFSTPTPQQAITATFALANQQYTGLTYNNISTGLVFGASPTTALDVNFPPVQKVDPNDIYNLLGSFSAAVGGPTNDMFTSDPNAAPTVQAGTGVVAGNFASPQNGSNGAVGVFTAAQVLFDQAGGPATHNSATRYYYGNVTITFNRFVTNPVIHIAGLGGSYRYFPVSGTNVNDPTQWRSTYFTTELEVQPGLTLTRMSGNQYFNVSGSNILNSAVTPNGASVNTVGGLFNDIGAATGSFRINGPVKTVVLRVYLRGSNTSQFPWSAVQADVAGGNRNPFTGDIWWISASTEPASLVTLPATGVNLTAALNGNDVQLKWKTETEVNSDHFEIERSTDGRNFSVIGSQPAAGNSVSVRNYESTDANMNVPVYYYRLKLVDGDNRYSYSNVAMVRKSGNVKAVRMYPNPATTQVNLEFSNAKGNYVISMYNQAGQEVITQKVSVTYGVQYIPVNRNSLADGSYIVRVRNADSNEVLFAEKVVLQ